MGFFDSLTSLIQGTTGVEKAEKKLKDITDKCKTDTKAADDALTDAKLKQVPADAAKVAADKATADAKLVAEKAATATDTKVEEAKAVVDNAKLAADKPPTVGGKGKKRKVRFSKKIKGGKKKTRAGTNKKRR